MTSRKEKNMSTTFRQTEKKDPTKETKEEGPVEEGGKIRRTVSWKQSTGFILKGN